MVLNLALVVGRAHERASPRHTNAHPHQVDAGGVYSAEFYMFWLVTAAAACSPACGGSSAFRANSRLNRPETIVTYPVMPGSVLAHGQHAYPLCSVFRFARPALSLRYPYSHRVVGCRAKTYCYSRCRLRGLNTPRTGRHPRSELRPTCGRMPAEAGQGRGPEGASAGTHDATLGAKRLEGEWQGMRISLRNSLTERRCMHRNRRP